MDTTLYIDPVLDTREAFNDRVNETELYFKFLNEILNGKVNINILPQLRYTLISVGYLVLYNLVESTSRSYLNFIHISLINERIAIEETTDLIKKVVIDGFRKYNPSEKFVKDLSDLRTQIMEECYDKDKFFSGNIDAKLLREIASKYGFKIPQKCYGLLEVKTKRNDLAHGKVSFSECSKNEAEETIVHYKDHIIKYLTRMSVSIENFIQDKKYKK